MKELNIFIIVFLLVVLLVVVGCALNPPITSEIIEVTTVETTTVIEEIAEEPTETSVDPNNTLYPFNTMSADWGAELYESGFKYYDIPEEYKQYGGCFPEVVQAYLWSLCNEKGIDYYIAVALIEWESGYHYDANGDSGNSKGYMQVYEKWHKERMEAEGVNDLYNPYGNIRVGINYLSELYKKYDNWSSILMCYNMGESKAEELWSKGIYESAYSREIQERAQEIRQELEQD